MSAQEPNIPYGETTGERLKAFALNAELRDRITNLSARYWEVTAYALLVVFAGFMRFWNLGARAMHHDESLHGFFSYGFTKGLREFFTFGSANTDTYKHEPFMHGPFQFIGNGIVMWIFQDGEFQSRILAAAMGTAMVLMPFLLRDQLGKLGALAAATFIAISPTLMYYSRFTREDIYTAFWTFGIVIFVWRYMASRENKWLYLSAGFMAGAFCTKETTFMTVAAFLIFFDFLFAEHVASKIRAKSPEMNGYQYAAIVVGLTPLAWAIAIGWPFLEDWRKKYDLGELPPQAVILIVMGSLAITQYSAAIQMLPGIFGKEWQDRAGESGAYHVATDERTVAFIVGAGLIAISTAIGLLWNPRVWLIAAAAFWVPFTFLSTTIFTNWPGFFSVLWGSMDYWISQQEVARGNQPDYYYFVTIPVYEFLTLGVALAAMLYYGIRGRTSNGLIIGAGILLVLFCLIVLPPGPEILKVHLFRVWIPFGLLLIATFAFQMESFNRFLIFWLVITWFTLTVASEKMPWLNVHIALPLAVLAARFLDDVLRGTDLRNDLPSMERLAPFIYAAVASAACVGVFVLIGPFELWSAGGWLLAVVAVIAVYWAYSEYSPRTAMQVAIIGAVAAFSVFTFRAGVLASWGHPDLAPTILGDVAIRDYGDVPVELLVYTQTSGDIPILQDKIDQAARESGLGKNLPIIVDSTDGYTWPWAWYLRDYPKTQYTAIGPNYTPPQGAIVFAARQNATNVVVGANYNPGVPYHHRRWFPEEYRGEGGKYTTHDFIGDIFSRSALGNWLDFWVRRTPPAELGSVDGMAFFPQGFDFQVKPAGPTVRAEGAQLVIGGNGSALGQLSGPSDVAFDASGNIYIADTNNNRISKYDSQGVFQVVAGGFGGEVSLNQPWSMAVDDDGTVFVADTWNHRIVKLDSDLKQTDEWGGGGQVEAGGDAMKLFGPRDIAITADGNVAIVDTGNARVVVYTKEGELVAQAGGKDGSGVPRPFNEPSSVAPASNGDLYVADFWNKRIVRLDEALNEIGQVTVDGWGSQAVTDRGYLAVLPDGRVLATDPTNGKVLTFSADLGPLGTYDMPKEGQQPTARPVGIATDGTSVLISDSTGNVTRKIPLSEIIP